MSCNLYIGTYTRGSRSLGLYEGSFDQAAGQIALATDFVSLLDPSYLVLSKDQRRLYVACEKTDFSEVHAFQVDAEGGLSPFSAGSVPIQSLCHLAIDSQSRWLLGAGYRSGSLLALPLLPDGRIDFSAPTILPHAGRSVHPTRQTQPHVHSACFAPDERHAFVCDLGTDCLYNYSLTANGAPPQLHTKTPTRPGLGPRHMAFSQDGGRLYVACELGNQLLTYEYERESGGLRLLDAVGCLAPGSTAESTAADIHLSPDGRFVYVSNRGEDSIACFALAEGGLPVYRDSFATHGRTPRHFTLTPDGRFLLVANQDSDLVVALARNPQTGALAQVSGRLEVPAPACVLLRG